MLGSHTSGINNDGNDRLKIRIASTKGGRSWRSRGISLRLNLSDTPSRVKYALPSLRL